MTEKLSPSQRLRYLRNETVIALDAYVAAAHADDLTAYRRSKALRYARLNLEAEIDRQREKRSAG